MTLQELRRSVGRVVGMDWENAGDDRNLIDSWCSQGVKEILTRTHCHTSASVLETTADEWQYDISATVMAIISLWRDGETSPTIRVTPDQIIEFRRANGTGTDSNQLRWALSGANLLLLWPTPTVESELSILFVPKPTDMSEGTHDPATSTYGGIPAEYHEAIELWALSKASDHEHEARTQQGVNYMARFDEYIKRVVRPGLNRKGGPLPPARVGRRGRNYVPANDVYPR